jgi:hypothetical protein
MDDWPTWIAIAFVVGPGVLIAANAAYALYLSHRHLDDMMAALKNGSFYYTWGPILRAQGPLGSILTISKITGFIFFPIASIRSGELHPTDLEKFPPHLKRLLKIDAAMLLSACIWLALICALLKLR